jgi:SAM-dependent methyltransferase
MSAGAPTIHPEVHPSNAKTLAAWDGDEGDYWVENEAVFDASLGRYRRRYFEVAAVSAGDRVLDIGCGTGQTTRDAARLASRGVALGVDLSSGMIERARRRAAEQGLDNAHFVQADAQIYPFAPGSFDLALSRTGAMFFGDPVAAFANIARALRPGGRLVLLAWQPLHENSWVLEFAEALTGDRKVPVPPPDAPGPFSLSEPPRVRSILTAASFSDITLEERREPIWFGRTVDDAYRFVRGLPPNRSLLQGLPERPRARALERLRAGIEAHWSDDGILYPSAMWIISARRA